MSGKSYLPSALKSIPLFTAFYHLYDCYNLSGLAFLHTSHKENESKKQLS